MKSGLTAGAIAGVVAGIVAVIVTFLIFLIGNLPSTSSVEYWLSTQIGMHIVFGAIIGLLYAKFYDSIWGKGISKGINFNMIIFLFSGVMACLWLVIEHMEMFGIIWLIIDFFARLAHGPVLASLYKK